MSIPGLLAVNEALLFAWEEPGLSTKIDKLSASFLHFFSYLELYFPYEVLVLSTIPVSFFKSTKKAALA